MTAQGVEATQGAYCGQDDRQANDDEARTNRADRRGAGEVVDTLLDSSVIGYCDPSQHDRTDTRANAGNTRVAGPRDSGDAEQDDHDALDDRDQLPRCYQWRPNENRPEGRFVLRMWRRRADSNR